MNLEYKGKIINNKDLVTKEYADRKIEHWVTMPSLISENVGKIGQYIGATTGDFIKGFFYECYNDTTIMPSVIRWRNIKVQEDSAGSYLPLAGGTMTGVIKSTINSLIKRTVDNLMLIIYGGNDTHCGQIQLNGKDKTEDAGASFIIADDGTDKSFIFIKPDGTFKKNVNGTLSEILDTSKIIDTHESTATDKVLSANQGKVIYDALTSETLERQQAIITVNRSITDEETARYDADTNLQTNINSESADRQNADATLQTNIDKKQNKFFYGATEPTTAVEGDYWADNSDPAVFCPYPIGATLVQYTATDNPNTLYTGTTWTDITSTMTGRYLQFDSSNAVGTTKAEELPNIKGEYQMDWVSLLSSNPKSGALGKNEKWSKKCGDPASGTATNLWEYMNITFNANNSNSIYQDDGKVQPLTYTVKLWQRTA